MSHLAINELREGRGADEISNIAYRLWLQAGRPSGRYMEFWIHATKLVMEAQEKDVQPRPPDPPPRESAAVPEALAGDPQGSISPRD